MTKKMEDFKKMKIDELKKRLAMLQDDIRALSFKVEGSKSKNVKEAKTLRKQVAQVLTEINHIEGQTGKNNKKPSKNMAGKK